MTVFSVFTLTYIKILLLLFIMYVQDIIPLMHVDYYNALLL